MKGMRALRVGKEGFTAVELIIVVATIAVLAAILIPKVTALIAKRKASRDLVIVNRIVEGLGQFYDDCGSYPTEIKGLVEVDGTNTLNGSDMTQCWRGPYIKYSLAASCAGGEASCIQGAFGTANSISILIPAPQNLNNNDKPIDYAVKLDNIPADMAEYLEQKIDMDDPNDATNLTTGKWVCESTQGTTNAGIYNCYYIFRETYQ